MKIDKNRKEEYKIARSEERVAARNARKAERRVFRVKQITSEEEVKPKTSIVKNLKLVEKLNEKEQKLLLKREKVLSYFNLSIILGLINTTENSSMLKLSLII